MKALIGLSGTHNVGKTTELLHLIEALLSDGCTSVQKQKISNVISARLQSRQKDISVIIKYRNKYVYVATKGDTKAILQGNIDFFDGRSVSKGDKIHMFDLNIMKFIQIHDADYINKYPPCICVSACRASEDAMSSLEIWAYQRCTFIKNCIFFRKISFNQCIVPSIITLIDKL